MEKAHKVAVTAIASRMMLKIVDAVSQASGLPKDEAFEELLRSSPETFAQLPDKEFEEIVKAIFDAEAELKKLKD